MRSAADSSGPISGLSARLPGTPPRAVIIFLHSSTESSIAGHSRCEHYPAEVIKMKQLSRRTVLRGLGAAVALPFLDAMYPAFAAPLVKKAVAPPLRMAFLYVPNGIIMEDWTPAGATAGSMPLGDLPRVSGI